MSEKKTLFELVGGRPCLERVHRLFYGKLFAHPWIGQFFAGKDRNAQEIQQTDFMTQPMGGEALYCGRFPIPAHSHMYITEEIFELRARILRECLVESGVPAELIEEWMRIDQAFKAGIVKQTLDDCKPRYKDDALLIVPKPLT